MMCCRLMHGVAAATKIFIDRFQLEPRSGIRKPERNTPELTCAGFRGTMEAGMGELTLRKIADALTFD
jgi:hypothetical protein